MSKRLLSALIFSLGIGLSAQSQAHGDAQTHFRIADGPVSLGIHLPWWAAYDHEPRQHVHGARCYRRYNAHHQHWKHSKPRRHHHDRHGHRDSHRGSAHNRQDHHREHARHERQDRHASRHSRNHDQRHHDEHAYAGHH